MMRFTPWSVGAARQAVILAVLLTGAGPVQAGEPAPLAPTGLTVGLAPVARDLSRQGLGWALVAEWAPSPRWSLEGLWAFGQADEVSRMLASGESVGDEPRMMALSMAGRLYLTEATRQGVFVSMALSWTRLSSEVIDHQDDVFTPDVGLGVKWIGRTGFTWSSAASVSPISLGDKPHGWPLVHLRPIDLTWTF